MSISFSMSEGRSTLEEIREARLRAKGAEGDAKRTTSAARVEANRRNAQRSTGPRTVEGKRRASQNALKHGLCRTLACLPSECEATFMTFVGELEEELRPATPLQRLTFNQIATLTWRLQRLPEAQVRIFEQELAKVEPDDRDERRADGTVQLKPSDVLARRFSDDPASNGFALLERYERGLRSQLLRLMKHYDHLQKHRATVPYDKDEPPCPDEGKQPAWTEEKARAQREWFAEQQRLFDAGKAVDPEWLRVQEIQRKQREEEARTKALPTPTPPTAGHSAAVRRAAPPRAAVPASEVLTSDAPEATARGGAGALPRRGEGAPAKRSQSKPVGNPDSALLAGKSAFSTHAPLTKRTQRDDGATGVTIDGELSTSSSGTGSATYYRSWKLLPSKPIA